MTDHGSELERGAGSVPFTHPVPKMATSISGGISPSVVGCSTWSGGDGGGESIVECGGGPAISQGDGG